MDINNIKWNDKALIPAIIQDASSFNVLMLGYMNNESLEKTIETNEVTFLADLNKSFGPKVKLQEIS